MTRVQWNGPGDRVFETGVDRGMFYLPGVSGVAWNGLVRISEAPIGGGSQENYLEGEKVVEVSSLEEYVATIEAFSSPREFVSCAGLLEMAPGVYAASQDPKSFGFSYRTLIGDDIQGLEMGYKIHLVYNALSKPADVVRVTMGSTPNVKPFSWSVTAVPELVTRYKPTSHFVIDTRRIDPDTVLAIEDILYGNDSFDPRLLTVKELLSLKDTGLLPPPPTGTFGITLKKLRISGAGAGISRISSTAVKMKKLKVSGAGTPPGSGPAQYIDLLPYLVATGAAAAVANTLVMTTGDNGGWPVLPGDTLIAAGGTGGAQPTGITDLQGNAWTKQVGASTSPASSIWTAVAGSGGMQTAAGPRGVADTITVTYAATTQAKQWTVLGCRNLGAIDLKPASTSGTGTSPSISSGTPAVANELLIVIVAHQTGQTINIPAGWHMISQDVTSGSNAHTSVFVKINRTAASVTFTAALTGSVSWSCQMISFRPATVSFKCPVGGSIFSGAYPGELSPQNNWQAHLRFQTVTGRNAYAIKRYCQEDDTAAGPGNDIEAIVGTWSGMHQVISVEPRRAVGGGTTAGDDWLRTSITYWKNNAIDAEYLLGNESNINGLNGAFGNGSQHNWKLSCPYSATTNTEAAANYKDYFNRYAKIIVSSGCRAEYNPALSSSTSATLFMPDRLQADGHPLLCGVSIDYYFAGDYLHNDITMDDVIAMADAMDPKCPVGVSEWGATDGSDRPIDDNPAGSLAGPGKNLVSWMGTQMTNKMSVRPGNYLQNLHMIWYANGTGNSLDTDADSRIITAYQQMHDALNG